MSQVQLLKKDTLVGVNYFAGWWRELPNKYVVRGEDWRPNYPERVALLGCYNDQDTMDAEIAAASGYGVDFFLMLWYVQEPERHDHGWRLNEGLHLFMASAESSRMGFAIEFCNHPPFEIIDDALWERSCREWVAMMRHPSYQRIDGKALFKVHGLMYFHQQCGGDAQRVKERLALLRSLALEAGVGELLIGAGAMAGDDPAGEVAALAEPYDYLGTYMDVPDLPMQEGDYGYEQLLELAERGWHRYGERSAKPYAPYVPGGWNPRPWGDPRPSFSLPDEKQWGEALARVQAALAKYPQLRLPDGTAEGQKLITIYAWNEFGEGGIVAPTLGDKYMKLEQISHYFGRR